jgi:Cu/Ag efflux protein CusF
MAGRPGVAKIADIEAPFVGPREDAMNARRRSVSIPLALTGLALALSCATSKELPKYADSQTVSATAVVQAIDLNTREVTLKGENGRVFTFVAGDQVKNLSQVHVGDTVKATYTESIAIEVKRVEGGTPDLSVAATGGSAAPGEKPAGNVARTVTASAVITGIDRTTNRVTLRGPSGNERVVQVRDPKNLDNVQVGDMVYATYTESLGIAVEQVAPAR